MDAIRKVLVVDDDPVVGKSFDRVLSGKGYAVIHAHDGEDALNKLRDENYDVVFTDIKMPGMNGIEVAERVKARQPWLPVVIITGYGTEANEARAKAAGVTGFLHKPLSPEVIEDSAREALLESAAAAAAHAESTRVSYVPEDVAPVQAASPETVASSVKKVALLIAAPFIGLAFVIALPFIGLGMFIRLGIPAKMEVRDQPKNHGTRKISVGVKDIGMIALTPFVGLIYVIALPFIGLGMLAWIGTRAKRLEA